MNTNARPADWTDKQWEMYQKLTAAVATNEARRLNQPSLMNKAPKGGWTAEDRIK